MAKSRGSTPIYIGIFLISTATLTLQIGLTRIFSVAQWYHFAFMAVSLALLGFGASGTFLTIFRGLLSRDIHRLLTALAVFFSLGSIASYLIVNNVPFDSFRVGIEFIQILYLLIYYVALSIPFFFAGLIIGFTLAKLPQRVNTVYCFSLVGSGVGALLVLGITPLTGEQGLVVFVALVGLLAAISFGFAFRLTSYLLVLLVGLLGFLLFNPPGLLEINISPYKSLSQALRFPEAKLLATKWNAFSRVDVVRSGMVRYAPGLSYLYPKLPPEQIGITLDGQNLCGITAFNGTPQASEFTDWLPSALAYKFSDGQNVFIVQPRGGLDVLAALHQKVGQIVVVEDNPLIVSIIRDDLRDSSGNLYGRADVKVVTEAGRSFVRRAKERFDLVVISLADSFGAVSVGAFSLAEYHLYTIEAFKDYFNLLAPQGIISVTRWLQVPPSESLRLGGTILTALDQLGLDPHQHIIAFRTWMTVTFLVKKSPWTKDELRIARRFCKERRFDLIYLPGIREDEVNIYSVLSEPYHHKSFSQLLESKDRSRFYANYMYDVRPTTDDRPFFFHFFKLKQIPSTLRNLGRQWQPYAGGGYLAVALILLIATFVSAVFILFPLRFYRKEKLASSLKWRYLVYFLSLGIGFLFIEISLMHHFILFLSHPIYAFSVVLGSIFLFSGAGSFVSRKLKSANLFKILVATLVLGTISYLILLPRFFELFLGQPLSVRILLSIIVLSPLSFLMGIPFPSGLRILARTTPDLVPWVFSINGFASVVSSILAIMLAISWGYSYVLMVAGGIYLVGLLGIWPLLKFTD